MINRASHVLRVRYSTKSGQPIGFKLYETNHTHAYGWESKHGIAQPFMCVNKYHMVGQRMNLERMNCTWLVCWIQWGVGMETAHVHVQIFKKRTIPMSICGRLHRHMMLLPRIRGLTRQNGNVLMWISPLWTWFNAFYRQFGLWNASEVNLPYMYM